MFQVRYLFFMTDFKKKSADRKIYEWDGVESIK